MGCASNQYISLDQLDRYLLAIALGVEPAEPGVATTNLVDVNLTSLTVGSLGHSLSRCLPNHAGSWCLWLGLSSLQNMRLVQKSMQTLTMAFATLGLVLPCFNVKSVSNPSFKSGTLTEQDLLTGRFQLLVL